MIVLAVLGIGTFAWVTARLAVCHPILDMIPVLGAWLDSPSGIIATLWQPLNEHHVVWMRLLAVADIEMTGGWPVVSGLVSVLMLACLVCVPALALRRAGLSRGMWWVVLAVLVLLVFAAPAAEDTEIVINGVYPQAAGLAMLSLAAAAADGWVLAFVLAVAASLGNGVALVLFPILTWQAWRAGRTGRVVAALGVSGAAFCLLYLHGVAVHPRGLPEPWVGLRYAAATLGLPGSHSRTFGSVGTFLGGLLGVLGVFALTHREQDELGRLAQGGILFGLGVAVLGALGRTNVAGGLPAVRYAVLVIPLQIGLLCLALRWVLPRIAPGLAAGVMLVLGLVLLGESVLAARAMVGALASSQAAIASFAAGARDRSLEPYIYPDLGEASRVWAGLAARGLRVCRRPELP